MRTKTVRIVALVASAALIGGAFASPAAAGKKKKAVKCGAFSPGVEDAAEAAVLKVTPKHTEDAPLVIEVEHGPALWPAHTEDKYANVQISGPASGLYIREEFPPNQDIDLYLFDAAGEEVASSGAFNPVPVPGLLDAGGNGGPTWESINGFAVATCTGLTINSHAYATPGTKATIKVWLGAVQG